MNQHVFQALVKWNSISKDFESDLIKRKSIKNEIVDLSTNKNFFSSISELSIFVPIFFSVNVLLFLLKIRTVFFFIGFCTLTFIIFATAYFFYSKSKNKKKIAAHQIILDSWDNFFSSEIYNTEKISLILPQYQTYCYSNNLQNDYQNFKFNLINSNLTDIQVIKFYQFMVSYCKLNIDNIPLNTNVVVSSKNNNDEYSFFSAP